MIQDVKGELIYEDFEKLMIKHGFVEPDKLTLLRDVFKSLSKSEIQPVLSIITGKESKFSKNVHLLTIDDLKALIYSIRNFWHY